MNSITVVKSYKHSTFKLSNVTTYSFFFVSLIAPGIVNTLRFFFKNLQMNDKRLVLKQSYLLLTWFYHLSFLTHNSKGSKNARFFTQPLRRKVYTLGRAPIAHKNWSKEQFFFQYYQLRVSFTSMFSPHNYIKSCEQAALFVLLSQKFFPVFETNLLFLKSYYFIAAFSDSMFFTYKI